MKHTRVAVMTIASVFVASSLIGSTASAQVIDTGSLSPGSADIIDRALGSIDQTERTANGFPVIAQENTEQWEVDGIHFWTAPGQPTEDLKSFVTWFNDNIEPIQTEEDDDWSWAEAESIPGSQSGAISNHASGTAVDLNAVKHPIGERGTFSVDQTKEIEAKVAQYDGRLVWGGSWDEDSVDEMHFEVVR